jgi:hypothetical protein
VAARRRWRRRRRGKFLAELVALFTITGVLIAFASWRSETAATDREHESRRAREAREEYKQLDAEVGRYVKGAKLVYRESLPTWKATGRWPRGEDTEAYEAVIDAGTDVRRLTAGVSNRRLLHLLRALRSSVKELCTATSVGAANRASQRMVDLADAVSVQIASVRNAEVKRLGMTG